MISTIAFYYFFKYVIDLGGNLPRPRLPVPDRENLSRLDDFCLKRGKIFLAPDYLCPWLFLWKFFWGKLFFWGKYRCGNNGLWGSICDIFAESDMQMQQSLLCCIILTKIPQSTIIKMLCKTCCAIECKSAHKLSLKKT